MTRAALWSALAGASLSGALCAAGQTDYVIHISVDGLRSDLLLNLLARDTSGAYAGFQRFLDEGATTFNARTDATHTVTLPNHTSMLTGRPVLQPPGEPNTVHHGYTSNDDPAPTATLHNSGNPNVAYIASAFDAAHDHGLSTAMYASKSKFIIFEQSYNEANGAADATGADDGTDKIDVYYQASAGAPAYSAGMNAAFVAAMGAQRFNYGFVHYRDPDSAGHAAGWGSAAYNQSVASVSGYLLDVFDLVETDGALAGKTAIILSSDHGGTGTGHGTASDRLNYTIPFFVWGPGVPAGADLYALNGATRLDPGLTRPGYDAPVQPIRNGDAGNLALALLGLPPIPGASINAGQDLVAAPCPCELDGDAAQVDAFDLLAYLGDWFAGGAEADFDGDGGVDVFDLLGFLRCWFEAGAGGACP